MQFCFLLISFFCANGTIFSTPFYFQYHLNVDLQKQKTKRVPFETQGDNMAVAPSGAMNMPSSRQCWMQLKRKTFNVLCALMNFLPLSVPWLKEVFEIEFSDNFRYCFCPCDKLLLKKKDGTPVTPVMESCTYESNRRSDAGSLCAFVLPGLCRHLGQDCSENEWSHDIPRRFFTFSIWKKRDPRLSPYEQPGSLRPQTKDVLLHVC